MPTQRGQKSPPAAYRRAAAVIPRRPDGTVLVGDRTEEARSYPGYLAFPGGGMEAEDEVIPLVSGRSGERACALRELGEECGRWLLATPGGGPPSSAAAAAFQAAVEAGAPIAAALAAAGVVLDDRALRPLGHWYTAHYAPRQFAVRQFLLAVPDEGRFVRTRATDELTALRWADPRRLRAGWGRGDVLLLPPIRHVVVCLSEAAESGAGEEALVRRLTEVGGPGEPGVRDITEGIGVQPYRTPTLPPATDTNTVLLGTGDVLVVDPATPYPEEQARFDGLLDALGRAGRQPAAVVLTHHHVDHVGDAARVRARWRVPVWAHPETAARVDVPVDRTLADGEVLVCPGPRERRFRVIFTPGHAPGHICLLEEETGVLIAGDMVAGVGSILIDPPEGHMGTYLGSLQRLLDTSARRVVPSHGPLLADGRARLEAQIHHRRARQAQVLAQLPGSGAVEPVALVPAIYGADAPPAMHPLAARSVLAALELLVEEGRARRVGDGFARAA